jgi:hypothetical protein
MFYWNHIARRQTSPMILHGMELTDPIRQFNDYGYTMCSTISGDQLRHLARHGAQAEVLRHLQPHRREVFYDGRWHMYDNSLSAIYTLCDGKTLAAVRRHRQDRRLRGLRRQGGARPHRPLPLPDFDEPQRIPHRAPTAPAASTEEFRCFNPNGLKPRSYYFNWDLAHRYILNLRRGEVYSRTYHHLGRTPSFYVPNHGADPEKPNLRYRIRGNGLWRWTPALGARDYAKSVYSAKNIAPTPETSELQPARAEEPAETRVPRLLGQRRHRAVPARRALPQEREGPDRHLRQHHERIRWREVWKADATGSIVATSTRRRRQWRLRDPGPHRAPGPPEDPPTSASSACTWRRRR